MKHRFLIAAGVVWIFALTVPLFSFAQPQDRPMAPPGDPRSPEKMVIELKKYLKLSGEQEQKILKILEAQDDEMMTIVESEMKARESRREEIEKSRDAMREKMNLQRKETDAKISAVLTIEQQKKYDKFQKNHAHRPPRMQRPEYDWHGPEDGPGQHE
jgi:Spy/CpxP family protein refolding chaperone